MSARQIGALAGALVFDVMPQWPSHPLPPAQTDESRQRALDAAAAKRARRAAKRRPEPQPKEKRDE